MTAWPVGGSARAATTGPRIGSRSTSVGARSSRALCTTAAHHPGGGSPLETRARIPEPSYVSFGLGCSRSTTASIGAGRSLPRAPSPESRPARRAGFDSSSRLLPAPGSPRSNRSELSGRVTVGIRRRPTSRALRSPRHRSSPCWLLTIRIRRQAPSTRASGWPTEQEPDVLSRWSFSSSRHSPTRTSSEWRLSRECPHRPTLELRTSSSPLSASRSPRMRARSASASCSACYWANALAEDGTTSSSPQEADACVRSSESPASFVRRSVLMQRANTTSASTRQF